MGIPKEKQRYFLRSQRRLTASTLPRPLASNQSVDGSGTEVAGTALT
jgi:hypothetical protein